MSSILTPTTKAESGLLRLKICTKRQLVKDIIMKKICLVTDAWVGQVNGVVTTLTHLVNKLKESNFDVEVVEPSKYKCFNFPLYKEIKMPWNLYEVYQDIKKQLDNTDYIHIATEGPIGILARLYCKKKNYKYITSYHTRFPEYAHTRFNWIPLSWGYSVMRWMHRNASAVLVTTNSMKQELISWGFDNMVVWNRGVDTNVFRKLDYIKRKPEVKTIGYVGRVSIEKNLEEFLNLPSKINGVYCEKVIVGDGPDFERLKNKYPNVTWVGYKFGEDLVKEYNLLDVMVFPSKTDTFGLVNLEAMACGTPVAAFPVTGPKDIIEECITGSLNNDLNIAVSNCLIIDRDLCMVTTQNNHCWNNSIEPYYNSLIHK